jgi:hypothetical protein
VQEWQLYGTSGQAQEGIDILLWHDAENQRSAWQCKRYETITADDIAKAVDKFMNGKWREKCTTLRICVSASLEDTKVQDEIDNQKQQLKSANVVIQTAGIEMLSEDLKKHPDLVDDFFGRPWVERFCGTDAASRLSGRLLTNDEVRRLRATLRKQYKAYFKLIDPGPTLASSALANPTTPLLLSDRYVEPDVLDVESIGSIVQEPVSRQRVAELMGLFVVKYFGPDLLKTNRHFPSVRPA